MSVVPTPVVEESANYDNYLDLSKRKEDSYSISLDKFYDVPIETSLVDATKKKIKPENPIYKKIYVHLRNLDDYVEFCHLVGGTIDYKTKDVFYPMHDPKLSLFDDDSIVYVDSTLLVKPEKLKTTNTLPIDSDIENEDVAWKEHWKNMPEYVQENNPPYKTINVKFRKKEDFEKFAELLNQNLSDKTKSIWHPHLDRTANSLLRWVQDGVKTLPKYPLYIVSKGRHESMFTSRSLARMQIPHYIVIEPQDYDNYTEALVTFNIKEYVTLLVAPFSNHGDGPGRARNWAWDHSISIGAKCHWVLDDNISDFYRLNRNKRIRFESGVGFRVMEDFVDRYDNVYISGPQYRFFIAPDSKYPPYVVNTRIYSTLLIRNDCKHRWRGRYNEDTDICLRVLKDGDCTIQFNCFLQGKAATQTVKGGNTSEFYHAEGNLDTEQWRDGQLNSEGTINKSQMLVDMHPDVARLVWRYGRWHHYVDYNPFKKTKLITKENLSVNSGINEYGMRLDTNYQD